MIPLVVCPECQGELRPRVDPRRTATVVSCRCGAQLLCEPHARRARRFVCTLLDSPDAILAAWNAVRGRLEGTDDE